MDPILEPLPRAKPYTRGSGDFKTELNAYVATRVPTTQTSLDAILSRTVRFKAYKGGNSRSDWKDSAVLVIDTPNLKDLAELRQVLKIKDGYSQPCLCGSNKSIEFIDASGDVIAEMGFFHGDHLYWDDWGGNAYFFDPEPFLTWLANRGMPEARGQYRDSMKRRKMAPKVDAVNPLERIEENEKTDSATSAEPRRQAISLHWRLLALVIIVGLALLLTSSRP